MMLGESEKTRANGLLWCPLVIAVTATFAFEDCRLIVSEGKFYGLTRDGFFAESKAMLPRSLIPVPASVTDEEAAVVEPVALALRVLDYMKPNLGDWVTIIGQGAIGLFMTQVALLKGCRVIAVD